MLWWALLWGVAGLASTIAKILFIVFLVLFLIGLILNFSRRGTVPPP